MLTPAQLATLKTNISADGALNALPNTPDAAVQISDAYNAAASPDFWVWRTRVHKSEYTNQTSVDGTTFSYVGTGFITRSVGERDAWREMFDSHGYINPALPQVRQAFTDIFSGGTAPAPANRTHLSTTSRRKATRLERVFATGTGSTGSPGVLVVEGEIGYEEIQAARSLP